MDTVRFGHTLRALRRRRRWTQDELGRRAGCSRSAIARIERGEADRFTVHRLIRLLGILDARLHIRILWHGEELDRLLDAAHAQLVEQLAARLEAAGWEVHVELTFQVRGERGSIDILAVHRETGAILVIEVKSVVPDVQSMLASLDRKVRLAPTLIRERFLSTGVVAGISRLIVFPDDRTARRRVATFETTFRRSLPARNVEIRRWLRTPVGLLAGVLFQPGVTPAGSRHRIRERRGSVGTRPRAGTRTNDRRTGHLSGTG